MSSTQGSDFSNSEVDSESESSPGSVSDSRSELSSSENGKEHIENEQKSKENSSEENIAVDLEKITELSGLMDLMRARLQLRYPLPPASSGEEEVESPLDISEEESRLRPNQPAHDALPPQTPLSSRLNDRPTLSDIYRFRNKPQEGRGSALSQLKQQAQLEEGNLDTDALITRAMNILLEDSSSGSEDEVAPRKEPPMAAGPGNGLHCVVEPKESAARNGFLQVPRNIFGHQEEVGRGAQDCSSSNQQEGKVGGFLQQEGQSAPSETTTVYPQIDMNKDDGHPPSSILHHLKQQTLPSSPHRQQPLLNPTTSNSLFPYSGGL